MIHRHDIGDATSHLRHRAGLTLLALLVSLTPARAQDLLPGAYSPAPAGFNALTIAASFNNGGITFDPSLPVEDGHGTIQTFAVVLNRTLNLAGRSASVGVTIPYLHGDLDGRVLGEYQAISRSGLADMSTRFAVNLLGAPAMTAREFMAFQPKTIVGVSVSVGIPTGQYDPSKRINLGANRWAIKPEVGLSHRVGRWTVELDVAGSFFQDNTNFVNGGTLEQAPIASGQTHLIYTIRPGLWAAADVNFWRGGRVTVNGSASDAEQRNSRLGATLALPVKRRQLRIAYSYGAYTTIGGDFTSLGFSYSFAWAGHP